MNPIDPTTVKEVFSDYFNSQGDWPQEARRACNELNGQKVTVTDLTDDELVAATNEYIQRTVRRMRNRNLGDQVTVMLYVHSYTAEYEIDHSLHYGSYSNEVKLKGGNLFELVEKHCAIVGIPVTPPLQVTPMLSAPEPKIEEAHFVEVNDDVPF